MLTSELRGTWPYQRHECGRIRKPKKNNNKKVSKYCSLKFGAQNKFPAIFPSKRSVRLLTLLVNKSFKCARMQHTNINSKSAVKRRQLKESLKKGQVLFLEVVQKMIHKFTKRTSLETRLKSLTVYKAAQF